MDLLKIHTVLFRSELHCSKQNELPEAVDALSNSGSACCGGRRWFFLKTHMTTAHIGEH